MANHRTNGLSSSQDAGMRNPAHAEFGWDSLQKISNYRRQAKECRLLARKAQNEEHRNQLLIMAETWETLAVERESLIRNPTSSIGRESDPTPSDLNCDRNDHAGAPRSQP